LFWLFFFLLVGILWLSRAGHCMEFGICRDYGHRKLL